MSSRTHQARPRQVLLEANRLGKCSPKRHLKPASRHRLNPNSRRAGMCMSVPRASPRRRRTPQCKGRLKPRHRLSPNPSPGRRVTLKLNLRRKRTRISMFGLKALQTHNRVLWRGILRRRLRKADLRALSSSARRRRKRASLVNRPLRVASKEAPSARSERPSSSSASSSCCT